MANGQTKIKRIDERGIVPAGGTTGQKLGKLSDDNFDVDWMDDNGSVLTSDMIDAIQYSNNPSAANVFATMNDIPADELTSDQIDAIAYANDPSMFNVFATIDDVSGMAAGNGLTNNDGTIELGGQLIHNTKIKHGASILQIGNDTNYVQMGDVPNDFFQINGVSMLNWDSCAFDYADTLWCITNDPNSDKVYRRYSLAGDFVDAGFASDPTRAWNSIGAAANGDIYLGAYHHNGDRKILKLAGGVEPYIDTGASNDYNYNGICGAPNGDIYVTATHKITQAGKIFKSTDNGATWTDLNEADRYWFGICSDPNGNIYATVNFGARGVYKQTGGTGAFVKVGMLDNYLYGIAVAGNGDVYATVPGGSGAVYRLIDGTGEWVETTCSVYPGYHLAAASTGEVFMSGNYRLYKKLVDAAGLQYGADYSALNVDNPRWIPDQGRVADMITESSIGLTGDEIDAIHGANAPSVYNPFATMDDVGGSDLTADELAAIQGANAPSAANVFATMADVGGTEFTGDEIDAIHGANNPSVYNSFATMADIDLRFGSGIDGDVSISSEITLSRNMEYNNLTIITGGRLKTNGFIVKVRNKLTITGNGLMGCFGINGQNGGPTSVGGAVVFNHNWNWPTHTGKGGNGGRPGAGGLVAASGGAGGSVALDNNNAPYVWRRGAGGGGGGYYGQSSGATVAQAGTAIAYGAAGGAGGNAYTKSGSSMNFLYGGSGGGGGGVLELWAHTIDNENAVNGIICNGAPGGNGATAGTEKSGNGGGGGGGCCIIYYHAETGNGLNGMPLANGGAAGTGGNGGVSGSNGTALSLQI